MTTSNKYLIVATAFLLVGGEVYSKTNTLNNGPSISDFVKSNGVEKKKSEETSSKRAWHVEYSGSFMGKNIIFKANPSVAEIDRAFDENPTIKAMTISSGTISDANQGKIRGVILDKGIEKLHMDFSTILPEKEKIYVGFLRTLIVPEGTAVSINIGSPIIKKAFERFKENNKKCVISKVKITYKIERKNEAVEEFF